MKSNYKPIGDYIQLVDERNKGLQFTNLLGISVTKQFIPSVANIIGTDMENYKIIRKNQFACSIMQVRRDKKMPVALYISDEPSIISQAYPIFEIKDTTLLLPEYLMMWFTRSEFDRQACFNAVGGVRGSLEWEDFCLMELPIPSIEKQREIVKEYNVIQNRIALNNQLIAKLEETAQTIYKQWFVDFEFPDENGKPYKSNGGSMEWCEELEKDVPLGWEVESLGNVINYKKGNPFKSNEYTTSGIPIIRVSDLTKNSINYTNCYYLNENEKPKYKDFEILANDIIITSVGSWPQNPDSVVGKVIKAPIASKNGLLNQNMVRIRSKQIELQLLLFTALTRKEFSEFVLSGAQGSANQASVTLQHLFSYNLCLPPKDDFNRVILFNKIYKSMSIHEEERNKLNELNELLLARMTKVESEIETVMN